MSKPPVRVIQRAEGGPRRMYYEGNEDRSISRVDFARRFTVAEYTMIQDSTDPTVRYLRGIVEMAERVNLHDPLLLSGLKHLVEVGILKEGRDEEILRL